MEKGKREGVDSRRKEGRWVESVRCWKRSRALEEGGAGGEAMSWKQHWGVQEGRAGVRRLGKLLLVCCCFGCSLASVKKGRFSQLCAPREGRHYCKNSGLSEVEDGSGQHRMRSGMLEGGATSRLQATTDCDQPCCWAKEGQGLVRLGEGWMDSWSV